MVQEKDTLTNKENEPEEHHERMNLQDGKRKKKEDLE